jgi:hypothetical protein
MSHQSQEMPSNSSSSRFRIPERDLSSVSESQEYQAMSSSDICVPCQPVVVSVGSAGHPVWCGFPCKYAGTPRGCKDGANCFYCHRCKWEQWMRTKQGKEKLQMAKTYSC